MWNAAQYLKFTDERSRPFGDLLAQVHQDQVERIVDLGCGTGHLTRTLAERWPLASVIGVDSSAEMLEKAQTLAIPQQLEFIRADISTWSLETPVDFIVSNAALQWVGNHDVLLTRLTNMLAPKGTIAVQMPNRFQTASQAVIEQAAMDPRWAGTLEDVGLHRDSVKPLEWYIYYLRDLGFEVNGWETTYFHILTGDNPVLDWLKGTGLRPLIELLREDQANDFLNVVGDRLKQAYPARNDITVFPMPRLFFVATRQ